MRVVRRTLPGSNGAGHTSEGPAPRRAGPDRDGSEKRGAAMDDVVIRVYELHNRVELPLYPLDVFTRTDSGNAEIAGGSTRLPRQAAAVLAMLDGKRTVDDIERKLPQVEPEAVRDTLRRLLAARLVRQATLVEQGGVQVDFAAYFR
jgi:hypothetical protein